MILDFATSLVAEGKVLVASQGGKKLPADAPVSADGQLSCDPHELYGDYRLRDLRGIIRKGRARYGPSVSTRDLASR